MQSTRKPWDRDGKTEAQRGYRREHGRLREQLLRQEPLCRLRQAKSPPRISTATIADHIVGIANGGAVHSIENLQPVCADCHRDKSARDKGHRVRARISVDGWPSDRLTRGRRKFAALLLTTDAHPF